MKGKRNDEWEEKKKRAGKRGVGSATMMFRHTETFTLNVTQQQRRCSRKELEDFSHESLGGCLVLCF